MKKNNGITLIALVVIIIVLLILAAISISVTIGDDGIISSGVAAQEETEISSEKEIVKTASVDAMGTNSYAIIEKDALQDQLDVITGEGKTEVYGESSVLLIVKFLETERLYEVDTLGNVTELEPTDESIFTITEDGVLSIDEEKYGYYTATSVGGSGGFYDRN